MEKELKIIMVEDSVDDAELIQYELKRCGFKFNAIVVTDSQHFLKGLVEFNPDIILSDFSMPTFDGLSALKLANEKAPYIPFLFVSGTIGEERAIDALKKGATDYILKDHLSSLGPKIKRALKETEERLEKLQAEKRLHKSENVRKLIMNTAMDAIVCIDKNGNIILWNKQAEDIFGWKEEEVLGKEMTKYFISESYWQKHEKAFRQYINEAKTRALNKIIEVTAITRDQKEFPVELSIAYINEGDENFYCAFIRDITVKKETESALKRSEERYHKMVEEVKDYAIIFLDDAGNVQNWNLGAEYIYGYIENEIVGKHFSIFSPEQDNEQRLAKKLLEKAASNGNVSVEGWRVKKDGTKFWAHVGITALHDEENRIIGFTRVTRDLTRRKEAEIKLIKYAKALEKSNEELEQFAYIASHDLQEPLRMVTSFLSQLENNYKNQLDERAGKYIFYAVDGATRMRKMILDLLEYSRVGRKEYQFEKIDMNDLVQDVLLLNKNNIEETNSQVDIAPLPTIVGAITLLQQVFHNLIGNSIKYRKPNQAPLIKISASETKDFWKFSVQDNGIGIEPQFSDKIFILFQRLHNKEEYSGSGIGLSICEKIIANHDGKIWIEPNENGTTFHFTISKELKPIQNK